MNDAGYEKFFMALQRINQIVAVADSTDDLISTVLNEMPGIFQCDRAWLLYPYGPDTPFWQVVMEHIRPECSDGLEINAEFPIKPDEARFLTAGETGSMTPFVGRRRTGEVTLLQDEQKAIRNPRYSFDQIYLMC